jgi:hypothetical protein
LRNKANLCRQTLEKIPARQLHLIFIIPFSLVNVTL